MKRTALIFYLVAAALSVRADYGTLPVETDEAMGEFIRFESRTWAAEMSGEGGRLAANTIWTDEHVILNDVYVPSGVTLTLGPGAKVKFCTGTRIKVEDGGAIVLNGAEGEEVVLTGFADDTTFAGIVLQSSSASYSDNDYVVANGFAFGKFATVNLNDTTAFVAGGQAIIPVSVSGSRESAFSFDWVAETNGVAFASGTMSWSRVGDGTKNIIVPFGPEFASLSNFTVRASLLRCCNASKSESVVMLSEFITSDIQTDEAMGDFIRFESREWTTSFDGMPNTEGGRLTANTVWSNEHVIVSSVYIPSGVTLTLTADTVVRFCEGTMIKIEDGGKLEIVGADGHDVILRGYADDTKYTGIVKMSSGTLTDNSYVRVDGFTLGTLANVALNNSSSFRSSGLALIPVTVSGSRDSSFSLDWVAETNGAPYKSGTMLWNRVSDGTKNISINYGAELDGLDKFTIRVAVHRACYANPDSCEVKISDFIVADLQTDEAMGGFIRFESRDWTTNFADVANAEGGRLAANTTWTGEHVILNDVYIPSGVTLTLAADALVRFCEGTMIKIEDGGTLNIVGAEGHDVIIRNYDGSTTSRGIVKMSSGTYTDNMYVQYPDFRYGNYPDITLHDAGVGRDAGRIYIPITLDGTSRNQAFNVDWETDKGASGTISWSQSSEGMKWIEIPVDAATFGGTETYGIRLTAARGANLAVADAKVTIYEFNHPVTETVSLTEGTESSNEFAVNGDIREQPIFLNEVEPVRYSGKWQAFDASEAAKLRVSIESDNGVKVLKEAGADETGEFAFRPEDYPVGHYTLKHEIVDKVGDPLASMSKTFSVVDREDVVMHGGTLTSNEIWKAGMTHVVYAPVSVPSVYTLFIEPGAIVKFLTGTGIDLQTGAALFANAIVFTHIDDDTVGGDTLSDGYTVAPPMDAYYLTGNFTFGDDAELRNITQKTALTGTLNGNKMLSKGSTYRVSGTFTIANGAKLTIPAGTVLKMEAGAQITVASGGTLTANGTRAAPIVFTSVKDDSYSGDTNGDGAQTLPAAGDWKKISVSGTAIFDHVRLLYASKGTGTDDAILVNGGTVVFNNSEMAFGQMYAIGVESGHFHATNSIIREYYCAFRHWPNDEFVNCVFYNCDRLSNNNGQKLRNCIVAGVSEAWDWSSGNGVEYHNCVVWNEPDFGLQTPPGNFIGQNGNVWGDPLFVDPENGDFRIVAGSPCVDAADSAVAPEFDFYGQPRITLTEQTNDVPVVQGQLADIGICEVMPRDVTSDIDLQPVSVRAEEKATPGQLIFVKWTVSNVGGVEVDGSWRDTISLVSENGQQVTLGDKITTSHIAVGGEVFCSAYFTVPAMAEGKWRLKVNVNSYHDIFEGSLFANNALTSDRTVEISLPSIDPAQGATDGVINAGVPKVLKLTFAEGEENRMVHLDVPVGVKVAYGFGFMPRGNSASGSVIASDTGVRFRVPEDVTDVYVALESDETAAYELSYSKDKIVIASVSPNTLPSSGQVTVTITGAGFIPSNTVELVGGGKSVVPESVQYVDAGTLVTTVDCTKLAAGTSYDLQVRDGETVAISANAVSVAAVQGKGEFWARLVVPDSVRQGRVVACYVEYGNSGTADLDAQIVQVAAEGDSLIGFLDGVCDRQKLQFMASGLSVPFGKIKRGESNRLAFNFKMVHTGSLSLYTSYGKDRLEEFGLGTQDTLAAYAKAASIAGIYGDNPTSYEDVSFWAKRLMTGFVGVIAGTVSDESGNRLTMMPVACKDAEGNVVQSIQTDSNGDFAFVVDAPGAYKVVCSTLSKDITIDDSNASQRLSLVVAASPHVEINVVGAEEPIVVSVTKSVDFDVGDGASQLRICDANTVVLREFQEDVSYRVALRSGKKGAYVKVVGSDIDQYIQVELKPLVSVSGCIHDSQSAAWRAGMLSVRLIGGGFDESARVDANTGRFEMQNVPEGDYVVVVDGTDVEYALASQYSITAESSNIDIRPNTQALTAKRMMTKSVAVPLKTSLGDWLLDWVESDERKESFALANEAMAFWMAHRPQKPPLRYRCAYNMSVYNLDLDDYLNFSQRLIDFMQLSSKTSKMEMIAYRMKFIHHAANITGSIYAFCGSSAFVGAKSAIAALAADAEMTAFDGVSVLIETDNESEQVIETILRNINGSATDIADALSFVKVHRRMLVDHRSKLYRKFARNSKWLSAVSVIVNVTLDIIDAFEAYARQAEAAEKCENAIMFMRSELALFKDAFEEYKDIAFNFGRYHNCEDGTDLYVPALEERSPSVPKSCDPNEMAGPMGKGDPETERFVKPGEWMTYTVYFENKSDATAAAQEVTVTNPLSEWLDWSTFEMGEVAFNNQIDLGLVGLQNGTSEVKMNGSDYFVRSNVALDTQDGTIDWYLRIVDPNTETGWPEDVFAGFLPPNDETFRGEGHLTYRVKVREDAPRGARIDNSAMIVFDYNDPIETDPAWWNTVGADLETWPEDGDFSAKAANVYDAFLADESGNVVGTVQVKTAKQVVKKTTDKKTKKVTSVTTNVTATATVTANGKKWSYTGGKVSAAGAVTGLKCTTKGCPAKTFGVTLGRNGLEGEWGSYAVFGARQVKPSAAYVKNWTVSFENGDWVQLKVDSKGVVKFAGSAKGKAYSGSTRLLTGDGFAFIPVVSGKNATLVRIESSGTVSVVSSSSGGMSDGGVTAKPRFDGWDASANTMVGVAYKGSPVMDGLSWPLTFTASKLPTGCKINASTGVISGVPTKTGTFLTKVTATSKSNKKWTATYVVTNRIVALPEWAKGQFTGTVDGHALTMSVGSTGKVSGKFKDGITNWTFSVSSFATNSVTVGETNLFCCATAKGTYTVKSGKKTVTVSAPIVFDLWALSDVSPVAAAGAGDFADGADNVEIWRVAAAKLSVNDAKGGTVKTDKSYGQVAAGTKVKLTATLKKGYTLLGWYDEVTGERLSQKTSFSLVSDGVTDRFVEARFAKESDLTAADFALDWNAPTNLTVGVSYSAKPTVSGRAAVKIASVTGLPSGLSYKSGKVSGVATTAKTNTVSVKVALVTNTKKTWTLKQRIVVESLPDWACDTFTGDIGTEGEPIPVTVTVASSGKVSGKYKLSGATWTFSEKSLSSAAYDAETGEPQAFAANVTATATISKKKKTQKLVVTVTAEGADILNE